MKKDIRESFQQWGLESTFQIKRFRFSGPFTSVSPNAYELLLEDFILSDIFTRAFGFTGTEIRPIQANYEPLGVNILSLDFFDRLETADITSPSGSIRGCYDEPVDGVSTGDKLRDLLVNSESENCYLYSENEMKELLFRIFRTVVVGGPMCQLDTSIHRYYATNL